MNTVALASAIVMLSTGSLLVPAASSAQPAVAPTGASSPSSAGVPQPGAPHTDLGRPGAGGPTMGAGRGDGRTMTLADYQARYRERVMRDDADQDGRVSLAEWTAARAARRSDGNGQGRGGGGGDPGRQFQMIDANGDGYLTPAEIDEASARRFARLDADHDGLLTPDERRAMRHGGGEGGEPGSPPQ